MPPKSTSKKSIVRPANQPSLFSFWGKKGTSQKADLSKKDRNDETLTPYKKKRRVDDTAAVTLSSPEESKTTNENQKTVITPKETLPEKYFEVEESETNSKEILQDEEEKPKSSTETALTSTTVSSNDSVESDENKPYENNSDSDSDDEETTSVKGKNNNDNPQGLSDYELLRLRNIARNNARLEALGLATSSATVSSHAPKKSKRPAKRPAKTSSAPSIPTRRSTRISRPKAEESPINQNHVVGENNPHSESTTNEPVEEVEQYEVSPVVQYEMEHTTQLQFKLQTTACSLATTEQTATLIPCDYRLAPCQGLSAIYSLNFHSESSWLVGAGKSGIVALWNYQQREGESDDPTFIDPVFSWKGHSGRWISEAQFLTSDLCARSPKHLVTAANDGTVCLWDLSQVSTTTGVPKLQQQSDKSWHSSGIFALDLRNAAGSSNKIATGSKDKTVAITPIHSGTFIPTWRSCYHRSKVGAVRFQNDHVLASASDDGDVAILDDRLRGEHARPVALLENLHQGRPHSVVWDPTSSSMLLTAGLDSVIQQWDLRYLLQQQPVCEYFGHVPTTTRRCKRIHHPVFYRDGQGGDQFVLTGGEGSHSLSMFRYEREPGASVAEGHPRSAVYSRGTLPDDCSHSDVGTIAVRQDLVATTVEGQVMLLKGPKTAI
jgi:WD40 repeat protein